MSLRQADIVPALILTSTRLQAAASSTMALSKTPVPLNETEIEELYNDFDHDKDGKVSFRDLEATLIRVYDELAPVPLRHHLTHPERSTLKARVRKSILKQRNKVHGQPTESEKATAFPQYQQRSDLHDFLCRLFPDSGDWITKGEFFKQIQAWNIPSPRQTSRDSKENDARQYYMHLPWRRRLSAWWSVRAPEIAFLAFVLALVLSFSLWQGLKYALDKKALGAFSAGVAVAKFFAGALYPTFFFLIISMSRWLATFFRKSYVLSRYINWDHSQSFHIQMSCLALLLSVAHTIGHLSGTFVYGSARNRQKQVKQYLGKRYVRRSYNGFLATRAGWSGLTALCTFIVIALASTPWVRKRNYEIFQMAHMLVYLIFATLALHGTEKLIQEPMLGYWLATPVLVVLAERLHRFYLTFFGQYSAKLEALDGGVTCITLEKPEGQTWAARAGQYVLVQVPDVSRFQWHPFTISSCVGGRLQLHVKSDGNWTSRLYEIAGALASGSDFFTTVKVGIDGPWGAPAQRFYTFNKSIVIGSGIGMTPFSACLADLEQSVRAKEDPWKETRIKSFLPVRSRTLTSNQPRQNIKRSLSDSEVEAVAAYKRDITRAVKSEVLHVKTVGGSDAGSFGLRRCDFHWSVREKSDLLWFSDLLNRAAELAESSQNFTLNIRTHITAKKTKFSTYVFRYLLDGYRTKDFPYSALTGLRNYSEFGRPDYEKILTEYYEDMKSQGWHGRVGVFHCGPRAVGEMLADQCAQITARASAEKTGIRFMFHNEVFG